jgi:transposase-like protein
MRLEKDATRVGGGRYRCSCGKTLSVLANTWLEGLNLQIWQVLTLTYHFCCLDPLTKAVEQCEVARNTTCNWYNYIRGVQATTISNLSEQQIGGPSHVVEIDEFHCFTPKHHKGRTPAKDAIWGFGGIDVNTRDVFVVPVQKRSKDVLLPLIRKHVRPGTTIYTDMWRSYLNLELDLSDMNIVHRAVNHKLEFVNLEDPQVHTQTVERLWLSFRTLVPKTTIAEMMDSYFAEFLYFVKYEWSSRHPGDRFRLICQHIGEVFPGPFKASKQVVSS